MLRDGMLAVSGQLDLERPSGSSVTSLGDKLAREIPIEKIQPPSTHRSVYLPIIRNAVPEALRVFDFAEPSLIVGSRSITNVPTQALFMLNDPLVIEQTDLLAGRVLAEAGADDARRVELSYLWTLSRLPETSERERALKLVNEMRSGLDAKNPDDRERTAWAALGQALVGSAEFRYID